MNLKKLSALSLVAAAVLLIGQTSANAQDGGYRFGVGYGYAAGAYGGNGFHGNRGGIGLLGGCFNQQIRSDLPHFAQHPPVYYSRNIVRRPYGVSPYAAPPGIMPVEMQIQPIEPTIITNPYFRTPKTEPADNGDSTGVEAGKEMNKETVINVRVENPFFNSNHKASGLAKVLN